MSFRNVLIVVGILLITPFIVKAEEAQGADGKSASATTVTSAIGQSDGSGIVATSSVPTIIASEAVTLHLDQGFVGRAASFDLFDGEVVVSWDAKTLVAPSVLTISRTRGGAGAAGQMEAGNGIAIHFEDDEAVNASGTIRLSLKADRPPGKSERAYVKIFSGSSSSTVDATFGKDHISISSKAVQDGSYVPFYASGMMRSGLASWYKYKNCNCAASPDVPKGSKLKVSRQDDPSRFIIVTVNDYGPDRKRHPERVIDLDKVAFAKIGNPRGGVLAVNVELVSEKKALASTNVKLKTESS